MPFNWGVGSRDAGFLMAVPVSLGDSPFSSGVSAGSTSPGDKSLDLVAPIDSDTHSQILGYYTNVT